MKKRFPAMLLALALCMGLAVPAFAAGEARDPLPTVSLGLPGGYITQEKTERCQIRYFHREEADPLRDRFTYDEEPASVEVTYTALPLGVDITINGLAGISSLPGTPAADGKVYYDYSISVSACSDPDGDGIFEERIFYAKLAGTVDGGDEYSVVPASEKGPFTPPGDDDWSRYYSRILAANAGFALHGGSDIDALYLTTTSDTLYQLFGPNTIIKITASSSGSEPEEIACFLITGESQPASIQAAVSNPGGGAPAQDMEFTLRSITEEFFDNNRYSAVYTQFTRNEEAVLVNVKDVSTLAPGSKVTVSGLRTYAASTEPWDTIRLYAWSDPDGDGVYDQQLFTYYWAQDSITMVPLSKPGPFTFYEIDYNEGKPIYSLFVNVCGPDALTSRTYDTQSLSFPSSVTLSTEFLSWLFGPNTLIQLKTVTRGAYGDSSNPSGIVEGPSFSYYIPAGTTALPSFSDVPDWCAGAVNWAARTGVTTGTAYTTFSPGRDCTQAQILTFLYRAAQEPGTGTPCPVVLPASLSYAEKALGWAAEKGMIDGSFSPSAPCTRADAVLYIWQAFGCPGAGDSGFSDVPAGADCAGAVSWAVASGIAEGYPDGTFRPNTVCNRGVIATLLHRAYVPEARL